MYPNRQSESQDRPMTAYSLADKYTANTGTVFLTGIQALARLPIEQLRADRAQNLNTAAFVSGYQGSPLGGLGETVQIAASTTPELPIVYRPGMNEEYAASAVMGSQLVSTRAEARYDGVVGIWYGKAPGVDRAADALRHAVFAGTSRHGGAVAIVGDDPAAKSSTIPSSSAGLIADMHMPLLYPGDPGEALDLGLHAIAMSRATGLWSALKIVADVADATASINLDPDRVQPIIPQIDGRPYHHQPDGRLLTPHTVELEREILETRYELARDYAASNELNHATVNPTDAWIGIIASGITFREVREALARLGLDDERSIADAGIRLLKMAMPIPFNASTIRRFADGLDEIFVIEEKQPTIESLVKDALYPMPQRPSVVGKTNEWEQSLLPAWGALDADIIVPHLRARLEPRVGARLKPRLPERERSLIPLDVERSPYFCSGCPHNRSTQVPQGAVVGAGIGCHTMTLLMNEERVGDLATITCMGNEGTPWIGMSDFVDIPHIFQNLGDGTYFHSGQLAIQAAVAANINITYKLLYNGTVAMTGGQDAEAALDLPTVVRQLLNQGIARVLITSDDPSRYRKQLPPGVERWDRTRLIEAQEALAQTPGVTVLIHDQACAAEARRARKRGLIEGPHQRVVINHRVCEGCGDCGQVSNCLSVQPVETPFGRKTTIDQTTCNLDYSCTEGDCPAFMTVKPRKVPWLRRSRRTEEQDTAVRSDAPNQPPPVAEPTLIVPADDFTVRITGIGGTGVVTVAQILGTAAMLDGFHVRGLDQIGLSQKAGPVVSDLRLSKTRPSFTNRLGESQADLLLALDQLVAASPRGLMTCDPNRTVVVGSTSSTPTGSMITDPTLGPPNPHELADRIATTTRPEHFWTDAHATTVELLGSTASANLFVIGMAIQAGALPISAGHIEAAIELNGVAAQANKAAFAWGRAQVADPTTTTQHLAAPSQNEMPANGQRFTQRLEQLDPSPQLRGHLGLLATELAEWGNDSTAHDWFDVLDRVAAAERAVDPTSSRLLTAVADGLFKLAAYKDEYEVARLLTSEPGPASATSAANTDGVVAWKLHPPILKALGSSRKLTIGTWAAPAFRLLADGKRLRGSVIDPFGRTAIRRIERSLPGEYLDALDSALAVLSADRLDATVALAESAQIVRGYDDVKLASIDQFRARLEGLEPSGSAARKET
ncbi:MAG: indolepyruvate ferredoxin oxidoreductase family protein [Actinomycetia bacterium]|nr:indolepyruvate ferredoxin oxidoreductase family protein [Actinomycetes bacterium]